MPPSRHDSSSGPSVTTGHLVDTDWIIDHLSGVTAVTTRLTTLRSAGLAVSIISLAELYEGIVTRSAARPPCSGSLLVCRCFPSMTRCAGSSDASAGGFVSKGGPSVTSIF
jgi:hypothetical protein